MAEKDTPSHTPPNGRAADPKALSAGQYRRLVDAITDYAIYMLDADGRVASWNPGAERTKGYTADEIMGRPFATFFTPEDVAAGKPELALRSARENGRFEEEGWRVRKDGTRYRALAVLEPIWDAAGAVIGYAKITRDVTEQFEAREALERAREQLYHAQKLEALGQLTGGVAHDFNNLLAAVLSGMTLLERRAGNDPQVVRLVATIRQAVQRGQSLTGQLLTFARRQALQPEIVVLPDRIGATVRLLERLLNGNIRVLMSFAPELWPVRVDPGQLEPLAVLNLCLNARDAMPNGGTVTIAAVNLPGGAGTEGDAEAADQVALSVSDTGTGIPAEIRDRIFEPFFTTKPVGKGSGLGLSQVYGFAQQSGGGIEVESTPGAGTTVTLRLPAAPIEARTRRREGPGHAGDEADAEDRRLSRGTVLVVEDELALADLTAALLEDYGFSVRLVHNAAAALQTLRLGGQVDAVFTDVVLPGGSDGLDLARMVREEFPNTPILLASGFNAVVEQARREGLELLRKPYDPDSLCAALDAAMRQSKLPSGEERC